MTAFHPDGYSSMARRALPTQSRSAYRLKTDGQHAARVHAGRSICQSTELRPAASRPRSLKSDGVFGIARSYDGPLSNAGTESNMLAIDLPSRFLAILAADGVGFSRLMSLGDRATVIALETARGVFRSHTEKHGGRVIDTAGYSVLAAFDTASGAAEAALAIQRELHDAAERLPEEQRMHFRIGIHLGDVIEKGDGTLYGDGVNIAARLQALAGLHLRLDLAGLRIRGLRHRRLRAAHRRLADAGRSIQ